VLFDRSSPEGGVVIMNRKGFTLIELLIVVVIIGILAAIAIPKFANTKEKAYIASMKSDLRNFVTAEEAYFADSVKYGTTVSCTNPPPAGAVAFCTTKGNALAVPTVGVGTQAGWTTSITNVNTTKSCGIYVGAVTPAAPATSADPEGAPVCR
jgi:prepilin-type N-terminal cleavage/methylation domain-containing protein